MEIEHKSSIHSIRELSNSEIQNVGGGADFKKAWEIVIDIIRIAAIVFPQKDPEDRYIKE